MADRTTSDTFALRLFIYRGQPIILHKKIHYRFAPILGSDPHELHSLCLSGQHCGSRRTFFVL